MEPICPADALRLLVSDCRHNRPISAHFQGVASLRASLRILVRRLERRSRREVPFGSSKQRIEHSAEARSKWGRRHPRLRNKMARFCASQLEFPLEISQGHIEILHGHLGRGVTE
jgi:hypothetical protein